VLLASRLDVAQDPLHRDRVDLFAVAAEEAARVDATVDAEEETVIAGDERLLRRALRNLLENARRYGGGGEITVVLRPPAARRRDDDRGLRPRRRRAAEMRERIFEPFFRLPGHAEQAGGVGLGLSLVKQIAERHACSVRCEAREGGGTVFRITLPAGVGRSGTLAVRRAALTGIGALARSVRAEVADGGHSAASRRRASTSRPEALRAAQPRRPGVEPEHQT
jgi:signal transduction histidine kinase